MAGCDRDQKEMVIDDSVSTGKTGFTMHFTVAQERTKAFPWKSTDKLYFEQVKSEMSEVSTGMINLELFKEVRKLVCEAFAYKQIIIQKR